MGKRNFVAYLDDEKVKLAKVRGINISKFFRDCLDAELMMKLESDGEETKEQMIMRQNKKIMALIEEIEQKNEQIQELKIKVAELENKLEDMRFR